MSDAGYDSSEEMGEGLSPTSGVYGPVEQDVDESRVVTLLARPEGATEAIISGTMMTLRHNWGLRNGW
jgi:hypothetical protein